MEMRIDGKALLNAVEKVAKKAGELILSMKHPEVYTKEGHANFVTEADLASQRLCLKELAPLLEGAHFYAEEQKENKMMPGFNWVIDPIDGTTNFMRGYNHSAISIGLVKDGKAVLGVVHNPFANETFSAFLGEGAYLNGERIHVTQLPMEQALVLFGSSPYCRELAEETFRVVKEIFLHCGDIRRSGSAALDLCYVACGRCDGFYEGQLSPWDYAASAAIIFEAGGKIGTVEPHALTFDRTQPLLAGNPGVYQALQKIAAAKKIG